jgi:hypothetical protein
MHLRLLGFLKWAIDPQVGQSYPPLHCDKPITIDDTRYVKPHTSSWARSFRNGVIVAAL